MGWNGTPHNSGAILDSDPEGGNRVLPRCSVLIGALKGLVMEICPNGVGEYIGQYGEDHKLGTVFRKDGLRSNYIIEPDLIVNSGTGSYFEWTI